MCSMSGENSELPSDLAKRIRETRDNNVIEATKIAARLDKRIRQFSQSNPDFSKINQASINGTTIESNQTSFILALLNEDTNKRLLHDISYGVLLQNQLQAEFDGSLHVQMPAIHQMETAKKQLLEVFNTPNMDIGVVNNLSFVFEGVRFVFTRSDNDTDPGSSSITLLVDTSEFEANLAQNKAIASGTGETNTPPWKIEMLSAIKPSTNEDYFFDVHGRVEKEDQEYKALFEYFTRFIVYFADYKSFQKQLLQEFMRFAPQAKTIAITELISLIDRHKDNAKLQPYQNELDSFKSDLRKLLPSTTDGNVPTADKWKIEF